jgi:hypothetical protein
VTVTCPEELVVPVVALREPTVALQVIALLASGLLELSFNVAVSVVEPLLWMVKLEGVTVKEVATAEAGDIVPAELPELEL